MADRVRIGAVAYLNTRPLVFGMQQGLGAHRIDLCYEVPSVLADRMAAGELDIGLIPVIELARMPDLELVPGLAIVTRGPSRSVLLVSRRPLDEVRTVGLDPESRTSNALVRVLFDRVWGLEPEFRMGRRRLDLSLSECDAVVRIGDKALFEPLPEGCTAHDLGQVWTARTGLPFVYAAWAARPGVVDREVYRILHESRRQGSRVTDRIAEEYTWEGTHDPELAKRYLEENILFRLGSAEIAGMKAFFEAAVELGLLERVPEIRLALQRRTACHEAAARPDGPSRTP